MPITSAFPQPSLSVVIPCYNEQESIGPILREWYQLLAKEVENFEVIAINDGSSDGTGRLLDSLRKELPNLRIIHQLHVGHEKAVRRGYEEARGKRILQVDASGRYESRDFVRMWENRLYYSCILAKRTHRLDPIFRRLLSKGLRTSIRRLFGVSLKDANAPFRLFQRTDILRYLDSLPPSWESVNITTALLMKRDHPNECLEIPVPYRASPSRDQEASLLKLGKKATRYLRELVELRWLNPLPSLVPIDASPKVA